MTDREAMKMALEALIVSHPMANTYNSLDKHSEAMSALRQALAQPKYHRGDRLLCLESEEYCVIHISGTDRQWVKFPDSHIGAYTNEQVQELFELLPKETDEALAQPEQTPVAWMDNDGNVCDWECPGFPIPLYTTKGISK